RKTAFGYNDDHTDSRIVSLSGNVVHKLTPELSLRNQTQFNSVKTDAVETAPNTIGTISAKGFTPLTPAGFSNLPLASLAERLQSHDRDISDYSIYNQTELAAKLSTGGIQHELVVGLELGHDGYDNQAYYRNGTCNGKALNAAGTTSGYVACVPLLGGGTGDSPTAVARSTGNHAGGSANTAATYINDTMALNSMFKVTGGLRYDRYTASVSNSINVGNTAGSTALADARQALGFTSVRLGGIWQPNAAQSYYLSYGTSFNPSLEQLTGTLGQQDLPPEKNRSYELGGKWDLADGNLATNAALFQVQKENAHTLISPGVYELDGSVRVNGLRAGATGRVDKRLQMALNYTYLDAKVVDASPLDGTLGKTLGNAPKHTLTAWATYEVAPHWEVGGGPVYMSERYTSATNVVRVGGYTRWDATLAYKQPKYDLRLNLFNLADKMYYDALIPSDGGRAVPGTGRSLMLSFNYRM
ncbi:MAG TPA: TonB-dependent siderophore receptor, partial [Janthinobacterium sp.]|nr:TonB-dependent siderophore receptor [Janthinobacterium sp.]